MVYYSEYSDGSSDDEHRDMRMDIDDMSYEVRQTLIICLFYLCNVSPFFDISNYNYILISIGDD